MLKLTIIKSKATFTVTGAGGSGTISLSPTSGKAGTDVTVSGSNFAGSKSITFKFDSATLARKSGDSSTDSSGDFDTVVTIPSSATAGSHIIYATVSGETISAAFTVTASAAINLTPTSGKAGSDVTVSGTNFMVSYPIIFKFDSTTLTPKSGETSTSTSGSLNNVITIPSNATAGVHNISVTVGSAVVTATFTITASAAINLTPTSGKAGSDVTVSGTNFMVSYPIIFKFDSTTLTPKSGEISTSTSGSFNNVITIPRMLPPVPITSR